MYSRYICFVWLTCDTATSSFEAESFTRSRERARERYFFETAAQMQRADVHVVALPCFWHFVLLELVLRLRPRLEGAVEAHGEDVALVASDVQASHLQLYNTEQQQGGESEQQLLSNAMISAGDGATSRCAPYMLLTLPSWPFSTARGLQSREDHALTVPSYEADSRYSPLTGANLRIT